MNLLLSFISTFLSLCLAQDYSKSGSYQDPYNSNRNQDPKTTDDYLNSGSDYYKNKQNPYDINRNRFGSDYDTDRNHQDPNYTEQNKYNENQYGNRVDGNNLNQDYTPRPAWDSGSYGSGSRTTTLEHESVIINEA